MHVKVGLEVARKLDTQLLRLQLICSNSDS